MTICFDFGPEIRTDKGYMKVTSSDTYEKEKGFGFADCVNITAIKRNDDLFTGDYCIPFEAVFLADVENGNYIVSVLIGDPIAPTSTTIKTNGERLVLNNVCTVAGQFTRETFAVHVREGQMKLSFSGIAPRINTLEITPSTEQITLYLAGDSTVTDSSPDGFPFSGWGQMLSSFFKHDVAVSNHAVGGRSSKSFITEGRLDAFKENMREGDYLFIQFGHNDQKQDEHRHTDSASTYKEYLRQYIEAARSRRAQPILVTSVHRRYFEESGKLKDTHKGYPEAMRELAGEENVPLIDLAEKSAKLFEALGPEGTKSVFLWGASGEWMNYSAGVKDNTHFQEQGSLRIGRLVVEGIRELNLLSLIMFLR